MRHIVLAAALTLATPGLAQVVTDCADAPWIASPANIVEPWAEQARTYANGAIRIAHLDTGGEPACCPSHLLVLSPSGSGVDGPEFRACRVVSGAEGLGFYDLDIVGTTARYDPARGLLLSVPVAHWTEAVELGRPPIWERLELGINQATGAVTLE